MRVFRALAASALFVVTAFCQVQVTPLLNLAGTSDPALSPDRKTLLFDWCAPDSQCGIYARPFAGGAVVPLIGHDSKESTPVSPRWSPDGTRIAFVRIYSHFDVHLFMRDFKGGPERDLGAICDHAPEVSWTPDSRFLLTSAYTGDPATTFDCRPVLISCDSGMRVRDIARRGGPVALSPDGRTVAYGDGGSLMLVKLTPGYSPVNSTAVIVREPREISNIVWTADGKQIVYQASGDVPYVRRVTVRRGARPEAIPGLMNRLDIAQFLDDGSALATETTQIEALWRADFTSTPTKLETVSDPGCSSGVPWCSPDGTLQAFITAPQGVSQISLANRGGTNERVLVKSIPSFFNPPNDGVPTWLGWSPDGKWLAFTVSPRLGNADIRSHLYIVSPSGGVPRQLGKEAFALDFPAWSPDSKSLYATQGSEDDQKSPIVRVDIVGAPLSPSGADGIWPRVSRDGKYLYFFAGRRLDLYRIPIAGGAGERLWNGGDLRWVAVAVGSRYLYLFQETARPGAAATCKIIRFDPDLKQSTPLAEAPFCPRSAYLSSDERFVYFEQQELPKQRVVLVRGLLQ
jgi:Tol biopolymer transport system component